MNLLDICEATRILSALDDGVTTISDNFKSLKTYNGENLPSWWDSLTFNEKLEIGSVGLHYRKISANTGWGCDEFHTFNKISKKQQNVIKFVVSKKDELYHKFDIISMLRL